MQGRILGYNPSSRTGAIKALEQRYEFTLDDYRGEHSTKTNMEVDFVADGKKAREIYVVADESLQQSKTQKGIAAIALTILLGPIGTLIVRLTFCNHHLTKALLSTLLHTLGLLAASMQGVGWILFVITTIYFVVVNYKLVT